MRVNTGVNPQLLSDQHVIAEYYELAMAPGQLRKQNFIIKGPVKDHFSLGWSHMNFFKDKLVYLQKRKIVLVEEMRNRGFTVNHPLLDLSDVPNKFMNDWKPNLEDSLIVRTRIIERLYLKPDWYRFKRQKIGASNMGAFVNTIIHSPCFHV